MKEDLNEVILLGKITRSKGWPPKNGQQWTNGSTSILTEENGTAIDLSVKLTVDNIRDDLKQFEDVCTRGAELVIIAHMGSYNSKGEMKHTIEVSSMSKVMRASGGYQNQASITGKITKKGSGPGGSSALIIEVVYRAKEEWKPRESKILIPCGIPDHNAGVGDRILVMGRARTGEKGEYVEARSISRI